MSFKPIKVLTFDVFGTLLDYSDCPWIKQYAEEVQLVKSGAKPYRVLSEIFDEIGVDLKNIQLEVKPNVIECLGRLKKRFELVPLSNADTTLSFFLGYKYNLPWTYYLPTQRSKVYKPSPRFYSNALIHLHGVEFINFDNDDDGASQVCHVAAHPYDLIGAQRLGMQTAFIDWDNDPITSPANFDFTAPDITTLTDMLEDLFLYGGK